jgi:hypothetical protein
MKRRNRFLHRFFTTENIIRGLIVLGLMLFASIEYELTNVLNGIAIVIGLVVLGLYIIKMYKELIYYFKISNWTLSIVKTIRYTSVIMVIALLYVLFLPYTLMAWSFSSLGVILVLLLIFDILKFILKKYL